MRPFIILFTALLTFSGGVAAFSMSSVIKQAEIIRVNAVTAATNTAITVSTTIRGFAANDPYQIKTVDVPKTRFMGHVKANLGSLIKKNAWYAGWAATMFAAGWAIDELTNQVYSPLTTHVGRCTNSVSALIAANKTVSQCNALIVTYYSQSYPGSTATSRYVVTNGTPSYQYDLVRPTGQVITKRGYLEGLTTTTVSEPVSDDGLYDSLMTYMLQDPIKAAQAFMVPDPWPYPYPEIFPDTVPYIPGVTQSDQELLDLYAQGLLQSTNPNAAHYVSPEKLAEIAALAGQLQQGLNPEAAVDAANQAAQSPVTQAQLEEILKKQAAAEAKADAAAVTQAASALAPATTALDKLNDEKADLEGMITDAPTAQPPSTMPNIFKWTLPTGNCQPYPFTFTIQAGSAHADDNGAFCQTYNEVVHPLIFWFLNMLTAIYIFSIWSRTMTSVVGGR
ncbi:hypothetical protein RE654_08130 [Aeromonas caviae]|uniref:hypothetical protein n=1 Tax=Aeromonas caviae TaxID=648 RepID=UPI0028687E9B|nr:hypothetical protein [Aeromonas caviae]WMX36174.1 hypothetical protein RE654_08130 [Aeromonas caviae]